MYWSQTPKDTVCSAVVPKCMNIFISYKLYNRDKLLWNYITINAINIILLHTHTYGSSLGRRNSNLKTIRSKWRIIWKWNIFNENLLRLKIGDLLLSCMNFVHLSYSVGPRLSNQLFWFLARSFQSSNLRISEGALNNIRPIAKITQTQTSYSHDSNPLT